MEEDINKDIEILEKHLMQIQIDTSLQIRLSIENLIKSYKEQQAELEKKEKEIQFQKDINKTEKDRNKKTEKSLKGQIIKQNKIIDLMAEYLERFATFDVEKDEPLILIDKEDFKQYFEKKAEEDKQC